MLGDDPGFEGIVPYFKVAQLYIREIYFGMFWGRILDNLASHLESANDLLIAYQSVYSLNCLGFLSTGSHGCESSRSEISLVLVQFYTRFTIY